MPVSGSTAIHCLSIRFDVLGNMRTWTGAPHEKLEPVKVPLITAIPFFVLLTSPLASVLSMSAQ